jgi:hypothetical protein
MVDTLVLNFCEKALGETMICEFRTGDAGFDELHDFRSTDAEISFCYRR